MLEASAKAIAVSAGVTRYCGRFLNSITGTGTPDVTVCSKSTQKKTKNNKNICPLTMNLSNAFFLLLKKTLSCRPKQNHR